MRNRYILQRTFWSWTMCIHLSCDIHTCVTGMLNCHTRHSRFLLLNVSVDISQNMESNNTNKINNELNL